MRDLTEQEIFWKGAFGDDYIARNNSERLVAANIALFTQIFKHTKGIKSVLEFGANIGLNLMAIRSLFPRNTQNEIAMTAVEINTKAYDTLKTLEYVDAHNMSIYDFNVPREYDFVFMKGVMIHQNPDMLPTAYELLYKCSSKYIMLCEYYNPTPVEVVYRGNTSKLFKRDFPGELMDRYNDLELIDYGFVYHRDNNFMQDDLTWFLMEKR